MAICTICGKKPVMGRSQSHKRGVAGKRWKKRAQETSRVFYPNIQMRTISFNGKVKKIKICTSCLKKIKKDGKVKEYRNIAVV
jgi:large subunit ribosomal protein L28